MAKSCKPDAPVAVVVIGRNEGERLPVCLDSVIRVAREVVYVDSDSSDDSVSEAKTRGIKILELDTSRPLTAARARNEGFALLMASAPDLKYVQFVDGDCELGDDWVTTAVNYLEENPDTVVVCGQIEERFPEQSVYNFLCQQEWDRPAGDVKSCGGNAMYRVAALVGTEGFRTDLIAGEEPELCFRLRAAGGKVHKLSTMMVKHDADMHSFSQWWARATRGGYAFAQGMSIHGNSAESFNVRESMRIWLWGAAIPIATALLVGLTGAAGCLLLLLYPIQVFRIARKDTALNRAGLVIASFLMLRKFPEMFGQARFFLNRLLKFKTRIIEYK